LIPQNSKGTMMSHEPETKLSRRQLLVGAAALSSGLAVSAYAAKGSRVPPDRKLNLAAVGAGGRGADNLKDFENCGVNVVALCDCDFRNAAGSFKRYPDARRYSDWRKMLDREKDLDAVLVATPDHNHAIVSIHAMKRGLHVYCEKPLAHTVWEAREMARVSKEMGVVTQMGTQGHAMEGTRRAVEVMRAGVLGDVTELHVWTDRPAGWWPQGVLRPTETPAVPEGLDWDVWLGPAQERPYHPAYVPFKWRGFWDFGTGAIGDMGIHNLDTAFWGLELGPPERVEVRDCSPGLMNPSAAETAPLWSIIDLHFPARQGKPPIHMTWYDGGKLPAAELFQGAKPANKDGGSLVIGSKGTLFTRTWHGGQDEKDMFVLLPTERFKDFQPPTPTLPRTREHHQEFVDACHGKAEAQSNFPYAAVLTESLLLGNVALRTGKRIDWDAANMRAKGCPEADEFLKPRARKGWSFG
jgi:predicted dehydrogenase